MRFVWLGIDTLIRVHRFDLVWSGWFCQKKNRGFSSYIKRISSTPNTFIKIPKITLLTSSSSCVRSFFFSYTTHFRESWPNSSFVVVAGLAEVHCCSCSLVVHGCHHCWCCNVTMKVSFLYFGSVLIKICIGNL